ncbi:MAG: hypothetical protein AAF266_00405 [Planctomycetota bacterium]
MSMSEEQQKAFVESLPAWVREDLIAETLEVWQPYYEERLTEVDAIEILLAASHLFSDPEDGDDETVLGAGTRL